MFPPAPCRGEGRGSTSLLREHRKRRRVRYTGNHTRERKSWATAIVTVRMVAISPVYWVQAFAPIVVNGSLGPTGVLGLGEGGDSKGGLVETWAHPRPQRAA